MAAHTSPHPPSIERVLAAAGSRLGDRDHGAVVTAAREVVAEERRRLSAGDEATSVGALADMLVSRLEASSAPDLVPVVNATGVILHTNLGRAPWPEAAIRAADRPRRARAPRNGPATGQPRRAVPRGRGASRRPDGRRGCPRHQQQRRRARAGRRAWPGRGRGGRRRRAGELVEIGGGVRIPEIVRRAGARLIEVGTTNRTRAGRLSRRHSSRGRASLILRVHPSNFRDGGFVEAPDPAALAAIAHRARRDRRRRPRLRRAAATRRPSGSPTSRRRRERLAAGADLVTLQRRQAGRRSAGGAVVGRADLIARMRRDPLARAMRPDKVTLAAVAATLGLYRAGLAATEIPVWRHDRRAASTSWAGAASPVARRARRPARPSSTSRSTVGGGSLPGETLPSFGRGADPGAVARTACSPRSGRRRRRSSAGSRTAGRARPADGRAALRRGLGAVARGRSGARARG